MQNLDDFIYENPQALKPSLCDEIIDRFEEDDQNDVGVHISTKTHIF